jgi:hypothetical protein
MKRAPLSFRYKEAPKTRAKLKKNSSVPLHVRHALHPFRSFCELDKGWCMLKTITSVFLSQNLSSLMYKFSMRRYLRYHAYGLSYGLGECLKRIFFVTSKTCSNIAKLVLAS